MRCGRWYFVISPGSIPLKSIVSRDVAVSYTHLDVYKRQALVGAVLGSRLGTTATLVYVLLGAIGLPIFANFSGGISSIVGVTGGYIWAWPIMTWLCGIRPKTENKTKKMCIRDSSCRAKHDRKDDVLFAE